MGERMQEQTRFIEDDQLTVPEIKEIISREKKERKSRASRIKNLFSKQKGLLKTKYKVRDFGEPVMFFEKRSGEVEFYENVTTGLFEYEHGDGDKRFIIINPKYIKRFGFGDRAFKGYYCHEDHPLPLPDDPFLTAEQVNIIVEKSLNDIKKWKTQEINAKSKLYWTLGLIVLGGIGLYVLYQMVVPAAPPPVQLVDLSQAVSTVGQQPAILG